MDERAKRWEPRLTQDGTWTLAFREHGECCHSVAGAWIESLERYARACRLRERALAGEQRLRVLDIGTGLGLNLAAAVHDLGGTTCELELVSLELDPDVLRSTLDLPLEGHPGREAWSAVRRALACALDDPARAERGLELAPRVQLWLLLGDARKRIAGLPPAPGFDAVFLDPFSPRVDPSLWSEPFLAEVALRMGKRSLLSTYSCALSVRVALARAGLRVGLGARVGAKASGTLASPDLELPPLPVRTARRVARRVSNADFISGGGAPGGRSLQS